MQFFFKFIFKTFCRVRRWFGSLEKFMMTDDINMTTFVASARQDQIDVKLVRIDLKMIYMNIFKLHTVVGFTGRGLVGTPFN